MVLLAGLCARTSAMPRQREPLAKKGAGAWEQAKHFRPTLTNRLIVHAVDDATNKVYVRAVVDFLKECKRHAVPFHTYHLRDLALARHLEDQCYIHLGSVNTGANTFFGFLHIFEDHREKMPISARALKAWQRMAQGNEGGPIARETVGAIALMFFRRGLILEAIIVLVSFDCFLREQDWEGLLAGDCAQSNGKLALLFGVRERGQKVKTGSNQGVIVQDPWWQNC